jgi:hypothetical protein
MAAKLKMVPWRYRCLFCALSCDGEVGSGVNNYAQQQWWRQCGQRCLGIVGHSLLACATPSIEAAWRTMHDNDSPSRRWCLGTILSRPLPAHATATTGAAQTNGSRVDNGALALSAIPSPVHNGNKSSGADKQEQSRRRCHGRIVGCSLTFHAMGTKAAAQATERNDNGSGCADVNALALLTISSPSCAMAITAAA